MGWHRRKVHRIFIRDGNLCHLCGIQLKITTATLDHILPVSKDGTFADANIRLACEFCNSHRGTTPVDFYKLEMILRKRHKFIDLRFNERKIARETQFNRELARKDNVTIAEICTKWELYNSLSGLRIRRKEK